MTSYDFERYLNVRNAYGASFDSTGERLSFLWIRPASHKCGSWTAHGRGPDNRRSTTSG